MSSDEAEKKVEENTLDTTASSADEKEESSKEEKVNSKPAAKKKGADPPKIKQPAKKRVKTEQVEKESKKEEKKDEKKKKVEEEESEEEDSAEENDVENHKAVPLLDQPLEISGSRKRKEVQRFIPVVEEAESKELKIPKGKGKSLGDIACIEFNIQRARPEDLKLLHRLCFNKQGKAASLRKTIRQFNGFEYEEASDDYEKKKTNTEKSFKKVTVGHLKNICNILDIEKGGTKDEILDRILSFLTKPVDSGKKPSGAGRSKRNVATPKNYDEGEERFDRSKKKPGKAKKKEEVSEESEKGESEDEEEEGKKVKGNSKKKEDAQTTEESAPEEEEEKPKKGAKKGKKAPEAAEKKAPPKKRATAKKAVEKKSDSEGGGDEDSEEEEPLSKKAKSPPTDEEIKTYVKNLLEGANLELITMKKVCQDVYAHYPDFDLGHKKDFIKTTVKSLISS